MGQTLEFQKIEVPLMEFLKNSKESLEIGEEEEGNQSGNKGLLRVIS